MIWRIMCLYFLLATDPARVIFRMYSWSWSNADSSPSFHYDFLTGCQWNCESYYDKGLDEYSFGHTDVASWPSNGQVLIFQYSLGHADDEFFSSNGAGLVPQSQISIKLASFIIFVDCTYTFKLNAF